MSITQEIKKEAVAGFSGSECCRTAFLSACLHTLGTLHFSREKGFTFVLTSECYEVLLFAAEELARKYGVKAEVSDKGRKTRKRKVYTVRLKDRDARLVLLELSILRINEAGQTEIVAGIDDYIIEDECCMRAYITGA
ncbi:MAG: DNA-binding protein WhiA, partial [Clostridia bacterium]|nr:DNA-binding protein WhiA [Clostridia bacterium]